jgi:hypothetical protein
LKGAGLVSNERKGYWIPYEIKPEALLQTYRLLTSLCSCGCTVSEQDQDIRDNDIHERLEFLTKFKNVLLDELKVVEEEIDTLNKAE